MADEEPPKPKPKDDDMSADIAELKAKIAHLESENERLSNDYNAALEELSVQLDASEETAAKLQEYEGTTASLTERVRSEAARREWGKLAESLGVKPEHRDDAWELMKYKADKDEVDPMHLKEYASKFLEGKKYMLESADKPARLPKGEGSDRGRGTPETDGKFRATESQLNNLDWMNANMANIAKASESGNFEVTEG
jgi:hypothetical protein